MTQTHTGYEFEGPMHTGGRSSKVNAGSGSSDSKKQIVKFILDMAYLGVMCAASTKYLRDVMGDQMNSTDKKSQKSTKDRLNRLMSDRGDLPAGEEDAIELSQHEILVAENVIDPKDITVHFRDVGGIDDIKAEIWDLIVLPLQRPDLFCSESGLVAAPKGILLYGAPGTGKTMLAKAIAKESGAAFVNIRLSTIMNKWFGESNKTIAAIFSLAQKLAPSIVFIDEIDTFLGQREGHDSSSVGSIKSEFLTMWDGILTGNVNTKPVMVLGATNRPYDVDSAILRRLPRTFEIGLPPMKSRLAILELILEKQPMTKEARKLIPAIAKSTEGYSGSDLKELCRAAAMEPVRELTAESSRRAVQGLDQKKGANPAKGARVRPVNEQDFAQALRRVRKTGETAANYYRKDANRSAPPAANVGIDMNELAKGMMLLQQLMGQAKQTDDAVDDNSDGDFENVPDIDIPDISN
eukprot:CAMPEP_0116042642 /NCGR_PEP_ID=MMETSP0321-20121206/25824_1 /TAXON_ID=163516 /ORGANISM="Leptocylindrus danicus var. danicus, Strain B650" /LENGTH=465 /DNA_ID=CAMNT_0003523183 /DNA_START=16 /DNA_END=1414 /DNA_ORIENTATION=-